MRGIKKVIPVVYFHEGQVVTNFIIIGKVSGTHGYIERLNQDGTTLWRRQLSTSYGTDPLSLQDISQYVVSGGGFLAVVGHRNGGDDAFMVMTNPSGDVLSSLVWRYNGYGSVKVNCCELIGTARLIVGGTLGVGANTRGFLQVIDLASWSAPVLGATRVLQGPESVNNKRTVSTILRKSDELGSGELWVGGMSVTAAGKSGIILSKHNSVGVQIGDDVILYDDSQTAPSLVEPTHILETGNGTLGYQTNRAVVATVSVDNGEVRHYLTAVNSNLEQGWTHTWTSTGVTNDMPEDAAGGIGQRHDLNYVLAGRLNTNYGLLLPFNESGPISNAAQSVVCGTRGRLHAAARSGKKTVAVGDGFISSVETGLLINLPYARKNASILIDGATFSVSSVPDPTNPITLLSSNSAAVIPATPSITLQSEPTIVSSAYTGSQSQTTW